MPKLSILFFLSTMCCFNYSADINKDNLFTPEECVDNLIKVINNLKEADNGNFFDWSGKKIPW